jgi:hypothetical protein
MSRARPHLLWPGVPALIVWAGIVVVTAAATAAPAPLGVSGYRC